MSSWLLYHFAANPVLFSALVAAAVLYPCIWVAQRYRFWWYAHLLRRARRRNAGDGTDANQLDAVVLPVAARSDMEGLTGAYQQALEAVRVHPENEELWEDLEKAKAELEVAWLELSLGA